MGIPHRSAHAHACSAAVVEIEGRAKACGSDTRSGAAFSWQATPIRGVHTVGTVVTGAVFAFVQSKGPRGRRREGLYPNRAKLTRPLRTRYTSDISCAVSIDWGRGVSRAVDELPILAFYAN